MQSLSRNLKIDLINDMASMSKDPYGWVLYAFEWGKGELLGFDGPDVWQKDILCQIRDGVLNPSQALRIAVASGNGIGKSALVAWIMLWSLSTFEDTRGIVTANTENQLRTKTWPELAKWHRLFIAKDWFILTATAIYSVDPEHEKTWRIDQIPWTENRTESFAGLHNKGKRIIVLFDEASSISDQIWDVTEGALTDENTEIIWCVFGNPTRNDGRFFDCFNKFRHRWTARQIDSREARLTNKDQIKTWVEDYGEDSDFIRVRVRGVFPNTSDRQFIPSSYVEQARGRGLRADQFLFAAKIISVDPSWTGGDEFVIGMRQGLNFKILATYQKNDDDFVMAGYIANFENIEKADAVFVDLGYGTGIVSAGRQLGKNWILIPFGGASADPGFVNKRGEMWNSMKQWLKNGGAIPNDPQLCSDIIGPEYYVKSAGPNSGKILLESKEDMKKRGLASPNRADALALTFALPVASKNRFDFNKIEFASQSPNREFASGGDYDVFEGNGYDPFRENK